jgi:hypothetical protein
MRRQWYFALSVNKSLGHVTMASPVEAAIDRGLRALKYASKAFASPRKHYLEHIFTRCSYPGRLNARAGEDDDEP